MLRINRLTNFVENGKRDPSVEVLQKLSAILGVNVGDILNPYNKQPSTVNEKICLMEQLEDEDNNVIYKYWTQC